jgi:hypothetical protein
MGVYINVNSGSEHMGLYGKRFDMSEKKVIVIATIDYDNFHKVCDGDTYLDDILDWAEDKYFELKAEGEITVELVREA